MLTLFWSCFKTFFICTFNASKVAFIHFYLNGGLHAVSVGKPSEWMSSFWMVGFKKPNLNRSLVFSTYLVLWNAVYVIYSCKRSERQYVVEEICSLSD